MQKVKCPYCSHVHQNRSHWRVGAGLVPSVANGFFGIPAQAARKTWMIRFVTMAIIHPRMAFA
jgi:hypothetical protein